MSGYNFETRSRRHNRRQNNQRIIRILIILGIVLILLLAGLFISNLSGKNKQAVEETPPVTKLEDENNEMFVIDESRLVEDEDFTESEDERASNDPVDVGDEFEDMNEPDLDDNTPSDTDLVVSNVGSDDENVIEAFTGNWAPIGTSQSSPHVSVYTDGSMDRIEIKRAVSVVTGIAEDDMIEWWVGNNGSHNTAKSTISNRAQSEYYTVYLSWVDDAGWQVTDYERIRGLPD